jgi:hypothetical protein
MTEKTNADYWQCKCCGVKVDENSEKKVLPIAMGGNQNDRNSALTFFVCPSCFTIQMPEEMYNELNRRIQSRIITPE